METEDSSEYFCDAGEEDTTTATELAAPPTLLEAVHEEVTGKNDGGVNDLCRILGSQPLIPLLQYVNRLGFEICSVNRTRKLGYINLNWPRCSARVTESLVPTDGSFCRKQNT